eukprot:4806173-Pyramimonas_sp.AAC.1
MIYYPRKCACQGRGNLWLFSAGVLSSHAAAELYEVTGGIQVDGLPPAPSRLLSAGVLDSAKV